MKLTIKNKIAVALVLCMFLGGGMAYKMYHKKHDDMYALTPDMKISASKLFSNFEDNESKANSIFLGKIIEVNGEILDISIPEKLDSKTQTKIFLKTDDIMFSVVCELGQDLKNKAEEYKKGAKISLKGKCTGYLSDVVLVRCVEL